MLWSVVLAITSATSLLAPAAPALSSGAAGATVPGSAAVAWTQEATAGDELCAADGGIASPEWLGAGAPAAATFSLLATAAVGQVPATDSVLVASRLTVAPATSSPTGIAAGSVLYLVRAGAVTLFVNGEPITLAAGESGAVEPGQLYAVANETGAPATLLRLEVTPPADNSVRVAEFAPAPQVAAVPATAPESALLMRSPALALPAAPARLFLACLRWAQPDDSLELRSHPGPVGVWVIQGSLAIDEQRTLPAAGCAVFPSGEAHLMRAGAADSSALLFGIVADGQPFWQPGGSTPDPAALDRLTCGDEPP